MKSKFFRSSIQALRFLTITFPIAAPAAELTVPITAEPGANIAAVGISGGLVMASIYNGTNNTLYLFKDVTTGAGKTGPSSDLKIPLLPGQTPVGEPIPVSISGNLGLAGFSPETGGLGSVALFKNLNTASATKVADSLLVASDSGGPFTYEQFGHSVDISGNNGLVGAQRATVGPDENRGAAYFYRDLDIAGATKVENAKLISSDGTRGDFFGGHVSLSGDSALVSALGTESGSSLPIYQGSAYLFRNLAGATGTVTENAKLVASDGATNDYFGFSSSLSGTTGLISAPFDDVGSHKDQGSAYLFRDLDTATGTIHEQAHLIASDGMAESHFGFSSTSLSGDTALIGASTAPLEFFDNRGHSGVSTGQAVYLFTGLGEASGTVHETAKIFLSNFPWSSQFGSSLDLDGDAFAIGATIVNSNSGKSRSVIYTGSVGSLTTLDTGNTSHSIDGISFTSRTNWIIGKTTSHNEITLSSGDRAQVISSGAAIRVGATAGSDFNSLTIEGVVRANDVYVGAGGNTGNTLNITSGGALETNSIHGTSDESSHSFLTLDGGTIRSRTSGLTIDGFSPGEINLLAGGVTIDIHNSPVVIHSGMSGEGGVDLVGSGTLELLAASSYSGTTTVGGGASLIVSNAEGSATGTGDVVIRRRTGRILNSLLGSGTVAGSVLNRGLVSPGTPQSPALSALTVGGDYTQTSSGVLQMKIAAGDQYDVLNIGGEVRLKGQLLVKNSAPLEFGRGYEIIHAGGEITGTFDLINFIGVPTPAEDDFRPRFTAEGGSGVLSIAPLSYTQVATTPNESHLAQALDAWISSPDPAKQEVVSALDGLTTPEYHAAFASISPGLYEAALSTAVEQTQNQLSALGNHLASRQLRSNDASAREAKHDVWALSTGVYADGSLSSVDGDDFNSGGFLTGVDMQAAADVAVGLFTGSSESEGNFPGKNKIETDRYLLGAYATYSHDGFYANSALGGGLADTEVKRTIQIGGFSQTTHSDTDGRELFAMLNGGYDLHRGNWTFGPSGGLQYSTTHYDTIHENGAGPLDLKISNAESDSLRGKLGGRVAYYHKVSDQLTLIPESRLFWQHEFLRDNDSLDATLDNGAGGSFSHGISDSDGDSFLGGVGVGFQTNFGFYGNVSYDIELGRENDAIHSLSVSADWKF